MDKILITGGSGFIGSFIVEEALNRNMETWVAVRSSSSRKFLQDTRIRLIELDFSSEENLRKQLAGHKFDYVVHAAGVTKCLDKNDFFRMNTNGTANLVNVLSEPDRMPRRMVFLSSLSIFGAIREQQPYRDIEPTDQPKPNTAYGESKLKAERIVTESGIPSVILRPTGVYGPREKDYFLMAKSIKGHVDFAVGYKQQDITFVYVKDVVQAVFLALDRGKPGSAYFLTDGEVYQSAAFSKLIHEALGRPWWIRITAPVWLLRVITFFGDAIAHITGKISALNNDKYHILKQRNWRCNIRPAINELGFAPEYNLKKGVRETIEWYKANGWL
ncbi:MAG: NAD-dependent epimerase/dehydratase family protein [Prevotella micans]|nr:NAD-dependent epimerase/dehydratase family protein [Prevotella micans]